MAYANPRSIARNQSKQPAVARIPVTTGKGRSRRIVRWALNYFGKLKEHGRNQDQRKQAFKHQLRELLS